MAATLELAGESVTYTLTRVDDREEHAGSASELKALIDADPRAQFMTFCRLATGERAVQVLVTAGPNAGEIRLYKVGAEVTP